MQFPLFLIKKSLISTQGIWVCGGDDSDEVEEVERDLVKAFKVFDLDDDGFITSQELECVLKRLGMWDDERCGKDCASMICSYDTNFDGKLDFQEFKDMMLLTTS